MGCRHYCGYKKTILVCRRTRGDRFPVSDGWRLRFNFDPSFGTLIPKPVDTNGIAPVGKRAHKAALRFKQLAQQAYPQQPSP